MNAQPGDEGGGRAMHRLLRLWSRVVKTTMIYTHVLNLGGKGVKSPVDDL